MPLKCSTLVPLRAAAVAIAMIAPCCAPQPGDDSPVFETAPRVVAGATGTPRFLFGSAGDLEMIAVEQNRKHSVLHAFSSRDQGSTFSDGGAISSPAADVDAQGENSPRFAMSPDERLYALWRQDAPEQQILLAVHDWRTGKYTRPIAIRDPGARGFAGFADLAVAPNGTAYVVWLDERDLKRSGDSSSVYFASFDGQRVSRNVRVASSTCPCCRPAVAVTAGGTIYVAWRHDNHDLRDIAVAASHDGGRSFSPLHVVAHDGWHLHGCPESGPSLLVQGRRLYVAWYTQGSDARSRVLLSYSGDGGRTFAPPLDVSQSTLDANHPMLLAKKPSGLLVVFQARDPKIDDGWSSLVPYIVQTRGEAVSGPVAIARPGALDATYPYAVSRDADSTYVSYELGMRSALIRGRL